MIGEERAAQPGVERIPYALGACFALSAMMMTIFPILSPDVVVELGLSYGETGFVTAAYLLGYGLFQIPASLLGIRIGAGRVLYGATILMSVAAILPCLVNSLPLWLISRFLMGVGGAAVLPLSIQLLIGTLTGPALLKGLGTFISGWGIGMTLAMIVAAPLLHITGWRLVTVMSAALGLVVIASLMWALPLRNGLPSAAPRLPGFGAVVRKLAGNYALNMMGIVNIAGTGTTVCLLAWAPLYLADAFGTSTAEASAGLSPIGIAVAVGAWAGGASTIRWGWRAVVVASLLASGLLVASIPLWWNVPLVFGIAIVIGFVGMLFAAPVQSLFSDIVPEEWAGLAAGYYNTLGFLGTFLVSFIFGLLLDWASSFAVGWLWMAAIIFVGVVAAVLLPHTAHRRPQTER